MRATLSAIAAEAVARAVARTKGLAKNGEVQASRRVRHDQGLPGFDRYAEPLRRAAFAFPGTGRLFHPSLVAAEEPAIAPGLLTLPELRNGDPTLLSGRVPTAEASQPLSALTTAPAARSGDPRVGSSVSGDTITVALDRMTAMQLRELTWGDPFYPATPRNLATRVAAYSGKRCSPRS